MKTLPTKAKLPQEKQYNTLPLPGAETMLPLNLA
jgi:hypothetical protein